MSYKILVADNDAAIVRQLKDVLVAEKYEVACASGGKEAFAMVASEPPDIVVVGASLADQGGFEFLHNLRADRQTEALPVIMLTSTPGEANLHLAQRYGVDTFQSKRDKLLFKELLAKIYILLKSQAGEYGHGEEYSL
jgi:DNA-binding response OmpR family regulator